MKKGTVPFFSRGDLIAETTTATTETVRGCAIVAQSASGKLKHHRLVGQSEEITGGPSIDLLLGPYDVQVLVFEEGGEANQ